MEGIGKYLLKNLLSWRSLTHGLRVTCGPRSPSVPSSNKHSYCSYAFWYWLWRNTITTANETHWSSVFRRFKFHVISLFHLRFALDPRAYIGTIAKSNHPYPVNSEHVWHQTLPIDVLHNKECQKFFAFTTVKSSLVWCSPSVILFI